MNTTLKFMVGPKSVIILLLFSSYIFGCTNKEKDITLTKEQIRLAKEKEEEIEFNISVNEIQSKHNAFCLDSLFAQDSLELTYSYVIESKITKVGKPLLARAVILDILKVSDSSYQLVTIIPYKKKNEYHGVFYAQLKCTEKLIKKIESLNLNSNRVPYVFLIVEINRYSTIDFQFDVKDESYDDFKDYDINLEYNHAHIAKGICLDIEYDPKFERFLGD